MVATLEEAFGNTLNNFKTNDGCNLDNDFLFYTDPSKTKQLCKINNKNLNCKPSTKDFYGFKISNPSTKVTKSSDGKTLKTNSNTIYNCSEKWDKYNNCKGTLNAECNNNWEECPNLDHSNMIYSCNINNTYNYNKSTNSCDSISGTSGKYDTYQECYDKAVLKWNYLKDWTCTNVGTQINKSNKYENPQYVTEQDCRVDSQKICKGLTSIDPKIRDNSLQLLINSASGKKLPEKRNGQIDCNCSIPY